MIARRKTKRIPLDFRLYKEEWDDLREAVQIPPGTTAKRAAYLLQTANSIEEASQIIRRIIKEQENSDTLTVETIIAAYNEQTSPMSFAGYMEKQIALLQQKATATHYHYRSLYNSFSSFLNKYCPDTPTDISAFTLGAFTPSLVMAYESHLNNLGLVPNTVSFYLRTLRAVLNKAIREGLIEKRPFFMNVNTRIEKTQKRAVDETVIRKLEKLSEQQLLHSGLPLARDLFLFSYYARGMAFIDIAFLTCENIRNGNTLVYSRRKTGQELSIKILPEMQKLIDRYHSEGSRYLFPILETPDGGHKKYESALRLQNLQLERISEMVETHLTTYVPRHTWASTAKKKGISEEIISVGMGYTSLKTTRIYIATDNLLLDQVNEYIISGKTQNPNIFFKNSVSW
ncbi:MAG: site-specific integrase [Parabacteroides sp.]|nr:site-specific integrase [Parabacteroides sp.]